MYHIKLNCKFNLTQKQDFTPGMSNSFYVGGHTHLISEISYLRNEVPCHQKEINQHDSLGLNSKK